MNPSRDIDNAVPITPTRLLLTAQPSLLSHVTEESPGSHRNRWLVECLTRKGRTVRAALRGLAAAYTASLLNQIDGPVLLVGHSYAGAITTNAANSAPNVVGLVYVAAFATDDGENLNDVESGSKDSILGTALVQYHYPARPDGETSVELAVNPALFRAAFAADLPEETTALMAATQRPTAAARSAGPPGPPPGRSCHPGRWSPPATRPPAPTSSGRRLSGRAPASPK